MSYASRRADDCWTAGEGEAFLTGTGARRPMTHYRHADHKAMFGINPH